MESNIFHHHHYLPPSQPSHPSFPFFFFGEIKKMGKGVPRNLTSKKVKTLSKAHSSLSPSLNSRSGAIIRQKQLTKCQQLTSQIHPNKCTNLTQASVGLLYRPKAPPVKAPLASKKKETQRRQNLKKS